MKGAVAAGHPLTAEAGARVLAEGGNAVDACVAAAFAAWVAESPLTGPGRRRLRARPARRTGGRPRVADFFVATPGLGRRMPPGAEMHAIDVGFGGDSETTQVFRIGEASCAVPGAAAGLEARPPRLRAPAVARARSQPAIELARERRRALAAAGAPARDPRPDPPPRARGPARSTAGPTASRLQPGDVLRLPDLGETLDAIARRRARTRSTAATSRAAIAATVAAGGGTLTAEDLAAYRVVWRRPVRVALPRPRGDLEPAAVVGRHPDRVRPRAARARLRRGEPGAPRRSPRSPR